MPLNRFVQTSVKSHYFCFKAMDQPDHVTRFLLINIFHLCNPISVKNEKQVKNL